MPAVTYSKNCYVPVVVADTVSGDRQWQFCKFLVASLKAASTAPWVTIGSSCDGSSGSAYSATADGVDRWAGKTLVQAAINPGVRAIWHVLENTVTGVQVLIHFAAFSAASSVFVFSQNKFNNGSAWRGGGTSTLIRPTDTVSTPAAGRELATISNSWSTAGTGVASVTFRFNCLNRDDGKGFYAYFFPDTGATADSFSAVCGVFPFTAPFDEPNPYVIFATSWSQIGNQGVISNPDPFNSIQPIMVGRKGAAGDLVGYGLLQPSPGGGSYFFIALTASVDDLDPVEAAYPLFPQIAWSNGPPSGSGHFRAGLPDFYCASNTLSPDFNTWNNKEYIQFRHAVFPYDTAQPTPRGSDRPGFLLSLDGDLQEDVTYTPDHRPFNSGLEVI